MTFAEKLSQVYTNMSRNIPIFVGIFSNRLILDVILKKNTGRGEIRYGLPISYCPPVPYCPTSNF